MSVAGLVIGNEVLTAKVQDANGALLIRRLRERGIALTSLHLVPDEVDALVEAVGLARRRARFVITSGGVGPTHDDVTVRAVALALHRPVVRLPELEGHLRAHYGARPMPEAALRMAEAPAGSVLLPSDDARFPVVACDGVFLLPGIPELFRVQLEAVLGHLPGQPLALGQLFLGVGEPEIARALDQVALALPQVALGSYPTWGDAAGYRVKLTVEHRDAELVRHALAELRAVLPPGAILREELPGVQPSATPSR